MSPNDAIRMGIDASDRIIGAYIGDLSNADILIRPVPGMNNIAWQLGHLIAAERHFVELVQPGSCPELPAGFAEAHGKDAGQSDDNSRYLTVEKYQELWKKQRDATLKVLQSIGAAEFDKKDPEKYPAFAPSVAALLSLCGTHALMHCGQFVAVRRQLGKPVTI